MSTTKKTMVLIITKSDNTTTYEKVGDDLSVDLLRWTLRDLTQAVHFSPDKIIKKLL